MFVPVQEPPWRAIRAFPNPQHQAVVHLHNVSGGILSGDSLCLSIEAGPSTRVQVTSVGATRIYRQRAGRADCAPVHFHSRRRWRYARVPARCRHSVLRLALQSVHSYLARSERRIHRLGNARGRPHRERRGVRVRFFSFRIAAFRSEPRPLALERYTLIAVRRATRDRLPAGAGFATRPRCMFVIPALRSPDGSALESRLNELAFGTTCYAVALGREHACCGRTGDSWPCARSASDHGRPPYVLESAPNRRLWGEAGHSAA